MAKQALSEDVKMQADIRAQMEAKWGIELDEGELLEDMKDLEERGPAVKVDWDGYAIEWTVSGTEVRGSGVQLIGEVAAPRSDA